MQPLDYDLLSENLFSDYLGEITPCTLNFSGRPINNTVSAFSVAGWIRVTTPSADQTFFSAPQQFRFGIDLNGKLVATFLNTTSPAGVSSAGQIVDTDWHFVCATFAATNAGNRLTVFLDGIPTFALLTMTGSGMAQNSCYLGENDMSGNIEIASWEIWERALLDEDLDMPMWGVPGAGDQDLAGLLVAFDFASETIVSSNANISFIATARKHVRPCLYMTGGSAPVSSATVFPIGNAGPWSLLTWVKTPLFGISGAQFIPFLNSGPDYREFSLQINPGTEDNATTIKVSFRPPNQDSEPLLYVSHDCTEWTHLALTYDNSVLKIYVNGNLTGTSNQIALTNLFTSAVVGAGSNGVGVNWCGSLQCMSVWNREILAGEIGTYAGVVKPQTAGLFAFFPLVTDTYDIVKYLQLNAQGSGSIKEEEKFFSGSQSVFKELKRSMPAKASDSVLLNAKDFRDLAAQHNIEIPERPQPAGKPDYGEAQAFFDSGYFNIAEPLRSKVIAGFDRNYRLGQELAAKGIRTGSITFENTDQHTVYYYHTKDGPEEIYRSEAILSPWDAYIAQIILDSLVLMLMLLGMHVSRQGISAITGRYNWVQRIQEAVGIRLSNLPPSDLGAMEALQVVVETLISVGGATSFIWSVAIATDTPWWSILFTVLNIVFTLASAFIPALSGGYYALRLVFVATQVGVLVADIRNKPGGGQG